MSKCVKCGNDLCWNCGWPWGRNFKDEPPTLKSDPPNSNLRDRIAAVMHDHLLHRGFHVECACGWVSQEPGRTTVDHDAHVADAVIAALGLQQEWSVGDDDGGRVLWFDHEEPVTPREGEVVETRHITEWTSEVNADG